MATSDQTIMTKPTLGLEYQDDAGGFKILTADHMGWAIQLYRNQWWLCKSDLPTQVA